MLKKFILIIFVCFLLTGCDSKSEEEISFASWGSITEVKIIKKLIEEFEAENPDIKINFIHIPQNYFQKLHLLFASNTAPDVIFINNLYLPIYESKLEDLSDTFDSTDFYSQSLDGLSYNGRILAIPRDISSLVLYLNLDLVKMPDENWTLEELLAELNNFANKEVFGISFEEDIYWLTPYISYFDEILFDCPKAQNFYLDLRDKYKVAPVKSQTGSSTLAQMFLNKKIAMYLSGRWMYPIISEKADFNWAVINFPYGNGKQYLDTSGWAISNQSKNKEASKKFIKYLSGEKSSEYFLESNLIIPARKDTAKKLYNKEHNEKIFIDTIFHSKANIVNKDYKKLSDEFNNRVFK